MSLVGSADVQPHGSVVHTDDLCLNIERKTKLRGDEYRPASEVDIMLTLWAGGGDECKLLLLFPDAKETRVVTK